MRGPRDEAPQSPAQPGRLERAGHAFATNPLYQGLTDISGAAIGLLAEGVMPGASAVVPAAITGLRVATLTILNLYRKRAAVLNAEVASIAATQPEDVLRREDFLHCYLATLQATIHTRREEKIRLFARLLVSTVQGAEIAGVDEFEELLSILDEMSFRELHVLTILDRFEEQAVPPRETRDTVTAHEIRTRFWPDFADTLVQEAGVPREDRNAMLLRLNRTGLFRTINAKTADDTQCGLFTERWYRLRQLIQDREGNVIASSGVTRSSDNDAEANRGESRRGTI